MQSGNSQVAMMIQYQAPWQLDTRCHETAPSDTSSTDLERNFTLDLRLRVTCSREEMSCVHLHSDDEKRAYLGLVSDNLRLVQFSTH